MLTQKTKTRTAILIVAVLCLGLGLSSCATKRNIDEIKAEIQQVRRQNETTQATLLRLDSLITTGIEADNKLRNDVSFTVNDLQQRIDQLLENFYEMQAQLQQISRQPAVKHVIQSSPGAQQQTSVTITDTAVQADEPVTPGFDCDLAYDEAFISMRHGDYEKGITGFQNYLAQCPRHQNAENAHYWIGECYYSLEKYVEASAEFEYLLENYKSSVNVSGALYKLARSKQELGKTGDAKKLFQRLVDEYPDTFEGSQAKERLKDLK